ncbi:MAG TPA: class I SAM-dependent methyltransferase [Phycisphaerae bacterium]|nr:class I SAM-dependent methyltransferase [Phycisphaerae bacterium]
MDKIDAIRAHYEHRISPEREHFDVLDWASAASQGRRFEVLAEHVPLTGKSLLDVGCGLGDLAAFLDERGIEADYTGVDVLEKMVLACRERFGRRRFVRADLFAGEDVAPGAFDVVFCSGVFNLNLGNNLAFLGGAIRRLLDLAGEHAVFNLLHARSPNKEEGYFFYDPDEVLALIPPGVCEPRILDGYLINDFTVLCRKTQAE